MAEVPEVAAAKQKLRELVGPAVDALEDLLDSEIQGIRLGASKEILDRGGVPAKHEATVAIEVGLDDEIETLLTSVKKQIDARAKAATRQFEDSIEDAIVVEDERQVELEKPVGEQAAAFIGVPLDDQEVEAEVVEEAWWQASPEPPE